MDMEVLTRPHRFLREEFGRDFTLIYGDVDGEDIVLYATQPLEGYERQGDVFVKRIGPSEVSPFGVSNSNRHLLVDRLSRSHPIENEFYRGPKFELEIEVTECPREVERLTFGVRGSFAYVASRNAVKRLDPYEANFALKKNSFSIIIPEDIMLAHEGTHLATVQQVNRMVPEYGYLILEDVTRMAKQHVLREAAAFLGELKYLLRFHPELEAEWRKWRSESNGFAYRNAYRILTEHPNKVAEMVERAKTASSSTN